MRANPTRSGINKLWIRFFLLAVFATMYVRDHARPEFHKALGIDPTDYDMQVFAVTSEISRQVFPLTLDIDNPAFKSNLDRLCRIATGIEAARARGGFVGTMRRLGLTAAAGATILRLYVMPAKRHALPASIRLSPAW
jgi:magnesium-protoporphyrin IX monomethyl ester (oxidative) cyclase